MERLNRVWMYYASGLCEGQKKGGGIVSTPDHGLFDHGVSSEPADLSVQEYTSKTSLQQYIQYHVVS